MRILLFLLITVLAAFSPAAAMETMTSSADIAVEERLGAVIPADIVLRSEDGRPVNLRSLADRPLIIAPVYYSCRHACPLLLTGLATALGKLELVRPGSDFRVISLSFDDRDTPAVARERKPNYLAAVKAPFPAEAWSFLTGDQENIGKFLASTGYRVQRDGNLFSHPVALVVLAPGGRVVRYLHGATFLPFQLTMAVTEAAEGKIGSPAGRVLTYCFSYDAKEGSYVLNVLKVAGTAMVVTVAAFFTYLMVTGRKRRGAG